METEDSELEPPPKSLKLDCKELPFGWVLL